MFISLSASEMMKREKLKSLIIHSAKTNLKIFISVDMDGGRFETLD